MEYPKNYRPSLSRTVRIAELQLAYKKKSPVVLRFYAVCLGMLFLSNAAVSKELFVGAHGLTVRYPDKWQLFSDSQPNLIAFFGIPDHSNSSCNILFALVPETREVTQQQINRQVRPLDPKKWLAEYAALGSGVSLIESGITDVALIPSQYAIMRMSRSDFSGRVEVTLVQALVRRPGRTYTVTCMSNTSFFEGMRPVFSDVLRTLRFLDWP